MVDVCFHRNEYWLDLSLAMRRGHYPYNGADGVTSCTLKYTTDEPVDTCVALVKTIEGERQELRFRVDLCTATKRFMCYTGIGEISRIDPILPYTLDSFNSISECVGN